MIGTQVSAQTVVWSDNFDSYTPQSVGNSEGLGGAADAPGVWTDYGGNMPFVIDDTFALSGSNSLRLDEGDALVDLGYGSDASINLPQTYTSGSYTLTFSLFIESDMDTYHVTTISEETIPISKIWPRGLYLEHDTQGEYAVIPATYAFQSATGDDEPTPLGSGSSVLYDEWVESRIDINLDTNSWQWTHAGTVVVPFGSSDWNQDGSGAALGNIGLYVGYSYPGANANGVAGSVYYDDFVLTRNANISLVCDADTDMDCDLVDIDLLYDAFGTMGGPLDLDGSGSVDADDIDEWLAAASVTGNPYKADPADMYLLGDADLNGDVNSSDLGLLLNSFQATSNVKWNQGDFDGDGDVDSVDLGLLLNNFGSTSVSTAVVPEPSVLSLLSIGLLIFASRYRDSSPRSVRAD